MDGAGSRMNDPVPLRRNDPERLTPWQSLKVVGFLFLLLGPGIPLTVLLWRLAVGG